MVQKYWYVLRSKPHKEFLLDAQLQARNIESYFPRIEVIPSNPRSAKIRPYFPSYLFINCDIDQVGINTFKWMPYAQNLICFDGIPAALPQNIINGIKKNIGNIHIQEHNTRHIKTGTPITVTEGPFRGYEGVFDSCLGDHERVKILLDLIDNKKIPITLNVGQIKTEQRAIT